MSRFLEHFRRKFELLIVDDDPLIVEGIKELFSSEFINITSCSNLNTANELMANRKNNWHAWLIDLSIEHDGDGIELIKNYNHFPYVIVLSGLGSMGMASKVIQAGALAVFDKDPALFDQLHQFVCATAALGFLLKGKPTQYMAVFLKLASADIKSTEIWAEKACITTRQLERICELHTTLSPQFFRPLYYTLWHALMNDYLSESYPNRQSLHPFSYESSLSAIDYIKKNYSSIVKSLNL